MSRFLFTIALLLAVPTLSASVAKSDRRSALLGSFRTPQEVWAGFDPESEPLETELLREETVDGVILREGYFTGMTAAGGKVRVYAIYTAPAGGKRLPGVLHIHGGGQTAYEPWVRYWAKRGYAAVTFNWGGEWPNRQRYTLWGPLRHGNHLYVGDKVEAVEPSVHESSWYLWTRISRRALTFLAHQPEVDPKRLGIFGVSMGGTITWPVAAMDRRVKAAVAIYGAGYHTYPEGMDEPDYRGRDAKTQTWRALMDSEAYAPLVRCPILFLNGSNDHHGKLDWSELTVNAVPRRKWRAYSVGWRHHIAPREGYDLSLWMDAWLKRSFRWPEPPSLMVALGEDGVPVGHLRTSGLVDVARIYYAIENPKPQNRFWREASSKWVKGGVNAHLPIANERRPLYAFGQVYYRNGVVLSTPLVTVWPSDLGRARATDMPSRLIDDPSAFMHGWVTRSPATDPLPPVPDLLKTQRGPDGRNSITTTVPIPFGTHKIGDPKWRGPAGSSLQFQVLASAPRKVVIRLHEREFVLGWKQFEHALELPASSEWRTVTLQPSDFATPVGEKLRAWSGLQYLEIDVAGGTGAQPLFSDFQWSPQVK